MKTRNVKGAVALGSLTATVALLAGLGNAQAQIGSGQAAVAPVAPTSGPGAGSFPQSFLVPGTNTSLSLYGKISLALWDNIGSQHLSDTSPTGAAGTPFPIGSLDVEGPGAAGGTSTNQLYRSIHGGLRNTVKGTNFAFETRTPTDLGEVKTVMLVDFGLNANQSNYVGSGTAVTGTKPNPGVGNNEIARIQWAYGTLGPWLFGQYNSAWADPLLINPDIGDQSQIGPLQTANIRRPQIRYTYLMGNGITLSGSVESMQSGALTCTATTSTTCIGQALAPGSIATMASDNTDVGGAAAGGINQLPSFNTGIAWDQPWGHLMGRVGVGRTDLRNVVSAPASGPGNNFENNVTQWHWAVEGGAMINTWGQDQWRGLVNYSHGMTTYLTDMNGGWDMVVNGQNGQVSSLNELALNTSYIHRFNPNWRTTGEFGIGFFNRPSAAAGFSNCATGSSTTATTLGTVGSCVSGGLTAAQLANLEKRHIEAGWSVTYSPVPGQVDISLELDYYDRQTQASSTGASAWEQRVGFNFYW